MATKRTLLFASVAAAILIGSTGLAFADTSPAILSLRRHFIDTDINVLTYQTMDHIFETVPVRAGSRPWKLPVRGTSPDIGYQFDGKHYTTRQFLSRTFTNALLIVKDGTIVYEKYRNLSKPSTKFLGMSMTKSFTSVLIGRALQDGLIHSVKDQIVDYVPELKGSAYDGVTIEEALRMRTGVDRSDAAQLKPGTPAAERREKILVRNEMRALEEAKLVKRKISPGTVFDYSTLNTTVLGAVLEHVTHQRFEDYMSEKLWEPMGAQADAYIIADGPKPAGHAINGFGLCAEVRDYARFGLMMLNDGRANGHQIVSTAWVRRSTVPEPDERQGRAGASLGYAYQWWTIAGTGAYMALGMDGQFIYVDPATKTVIVKLSYFPRKPSGNLTGESVAFFRAVSAWKPGVVAAPPKN